MKLIDSILKKHFKFNRIGLFPFLIIFSIGLLISQSAFASPTVSWDVGIHFLGDGGIGGPPVKITVNDAAANTTAIDKIPVKITSTSDPTGISLTLTETGNKTATFKNTNLIFYTGDGLIPIGSTITVTISNPSANTNPAAINTLSVLAQSTSDPTGLSLTFSETGVNTGVFSGKITFKTIAGGSSGSTLNVVGGDEVTIRDVSSSLSSNALITPNPNSGFGAIRARIGDTVTVTYQGVTASTLLGNDTLIPGGGGGGLIAHPGFVLDVLAAIGGSPYIVSPPSFGGDGYYFSDGLTLTQGTHKTSFDISKYNNEIPMQVMVTDKKVNMTFKTFESYNPTAVIHMGLYFIPRGEDMLTTNSLASIIYEKNLPVEINDPNHILSSASGSSTSDGKFQYAQFSFVPTKSYDKMSFLARAWNDYMYSTDVRVHDEVDKPIAPRTLPAGVIMYDTFGDLETTLEKDGFYKPQIMAHIHGTTDVFSSTEGGHVYWLYDTVQHSVTLVIADKNDNELYSYRESLVPYVADKKGDYGFMQFTVQQLNRLDQKQEEHTMEIEAAKAMFSALEKRLIVKSNW